MNAANVQRVIDAIKNERIGNTYVKFAFETWNAGINCGTSACIGGTACLLAGSRDTCLADQDARAFLDISCEQSEELFYAWKYRDLRALRLNEITRRHAIRTLEHLRDTGNVDWSATA